MVSPDSTSHRSRLLFEEFLETDFKGSIYHPNFASFDIDLENGLGQRKERFPPTLTGELRNGYVNRFHILASFLKQKPYAFSFSADKSRRLENREFFEQEIINSTVYAGNFGLRNKFIPVTLTLRNSLINIERVTRSSQSYKDDEVGLSLSNKSKLVGDTRFDFNFDKFSRTESDATGQKGNASDLSLYNEKDLFGDNRKLLNSFLRYYRLTGTRDSSILNLNERFKINHTDKFSTYYNYNFSDRSSGDVKITDNRLGAGLNHKLYESLNSNLNAFYFNSKSDAFSQNSFGLSADEDYVKKLGKIGRINLGVGLKYAQEDRRIFGDAIRVVDESHKLSDADVTFLNLPNVDTSTVVVTEGGAIKTGYQLIPVGERTQIKRTLGGDIIDGDTVLVDYTASATGSFKFNTIADNYRARIDFLDDLVGVYYKLIKERHPNVSGQEDTILQTLTDKIYGADFHYKNLELSVENEDYDSNLSPYKRLSLSESFFFHPTTKSTLTFQSSQSTIRLKDSGGIQKFFDFISRFNAKLNRYMLLSAEGGFRKQSGAGIKVNDLILGSGLEIILGKFRMEMEYNFRKELLSDGRLQNHFFFTKIKREF